MGSDGWVGGGWVWVYCVGCWSFCGLWVKDLGWRHCRSRLVAAVLWVLVWWLLEFICWWVGWVGVLGWWLVEVVDVSRRIWLGFVWVGVWLGFVWVVKDLAGIWWVVWVGVMVVCCRIWLDLFRFALSYVFGCEDVVVVWWWLLILFDEL